ncbi:LCP family protein [Alicyclobacillus sp. SO9]|uniref:LCP family protein n=1 Tax=Alicyclobacillus sp. SO9 TaxID=2665646 RepID=UPI0018E82B67|nr:LCP family protein [Alicyclobacillus sp. SO9]QQE79196.1 LCP family protein [Alicyclobacillus sp. SO9]
MDRKNNRNKWWSKKRNINIFTVIGLVLVAGIGFGYYQYGQLQPQHVFNNVPAIGTPQQTTNTTTSSANAVSTPPPRTTPGTFNMLLIGTDTRPGHKLGHSDSMILVHVDLNTHQYNLLSIPRDARVKFAPYGYTKLTSVQYMDEAKYGTKKGIIDTVKEISQLTGVPINYYAETDYWGLQDMVNVIGGIQINLPFKVTLTHAWYSQDEGKTFSKGPHFLNGRLTTEIVHERYSVPGTDYGRQRLQESALVGIAKELVKPKNISKVPQELKTLPKYLIATNLTKADMMSIFFGAKGDFHPNSQIHYHQVKGKGAFVYNGVLQAKDDEIILQPGQLKNAAKKYLEG